MAIINQQANLVLDFWFGGNQQENYKTKWFPEGSSDIQAKADADVANQFRDIFNSAVEGELHAWEAEVDSSVALIVVLDQFSRHIFRYDGVPANDEVRSRVDQLALAVAVRFHASHDVIKLPVAKFVFSLMPLRHNANVGNLSTVLQFIDEKELFEEKSAELLHRFRKQTIRRLQHLKDRQKLEATEDILERFPFDADESNIMSHPLVHTTEAFLFKHLVGKELIRKLKPGESEDSTPRRTIYLSLSGGVDSMVISKILCLLRKAGRLPIGRILAAHMDYANRPESGREAAYVSEWCDQLGIECRIRRVGEVTRGITARDEYERVARDIRYQFYQQCMAEELTAGEAAIPAEMQAGMIFGHHLGDVQENVISNVMRGCSPFYLSGMTETSVTNGVKVWRPLLHHSKELIYEFAHTYGVPYFKDSTPSWSTRGKLRTKLVPLLVDIYGEGCLHNLTALAQESDSARDLVFSNIYEPFLRSVKRFPCGLAVNIAAYRSQSVSFWKEMLKALMHSMGMSMIRDKAVHNFVEKLEKSSRQVQMPSGWLELRKGYHILLTAAGELVVVRDGVLRRNLVVFNPATTLNQMKQQKSSGDAVPAPSHTARPLFVVHTDPFKVNMTDADALAVVSAAEFTERAPRGGLSIGPWTVAFDIQPLQETTSLSSLAKNPESLLSSCEDVLSGRFTYSIWLPDTLQELPLLLAFEYLNAAGLLEMQKLHQLIAKSRKKGGGKEESLGWWSLLSFDWNATDQRLRDGMPLLIPDPSFIGNMDAATCSRTLTIAFSYEGNVQHSNH